MYDVVTIGSTTWDNFLESDFQVTPWKKAPSGKALVFPLGEKLGVSKIYSTVGGNSANASVTFARQGFRVACFGKIGDDVPGKQVIEQLKGEKVKTLFVASKEEPTAYSTLLLRKGERTILGYHGASDTMVKRDIPWKELKAKWWYLSLAGESDKLLKPLLKFAKQNNIRVAFNPSGHHIKHKAKAILSSLKDIDFLVLNEGEAAELVGIPFKYEKQVFKKLDDLMPGIVAVTNGSKGVTVSDGKYIYKAGIFKEKHIADRTGAGDSFGSGFVAGLAEKITNYQLPITNYSPSAIKYAIRLATANAASVVEHIGATEGILTKKRFSSPRWKKLPIRMRKI